MGRASPVEPPARPGRAGRPVLAASAFLAALVLASAPALGACPGGCGHGRAGTCGRPAAGGKGRSRAGRKPLPADGTSPGEAPRAEPRPESGDGK